MQAIEWPKNLNYYFKEMNNFVERLFQDYLIFKFVASQILKKYTEINVRNKTPGG